jgi:ParB/RepB/Spo0J family partition protein
METQVINATEYRNVSLALLNESKTNPRRNFDEPALMELAESIRTQGVLSPLLVRPLTENGFEIIAGARRYRAAQMAEVATVPVRIVHLSDAQAVEMSIVENLQRKDVHPMEEAQGSLVELHPDNRVVELSFVSFIPFILCRGRSLSEPAVLRRRTDASCGFTPPRAV